MMADRFGRPGDPPIQYHLEHMEGRYTVDAGVVVKCVVFKCVVQFRELFDVQILGLMPGSVGMPIIVCVLPEPVCPYAKTHAL